MMRNSKKGKLPAVFPILLYNGIEEWTIPVNIKDLIDNKIPDKYIPSFEYYKIIEKEIPDKVLLEINNLVSAVIYLENIRDKKGLKDGVKKIIELVKNENIIDLKQFTIWLNKMFESSIKDDIIYELRDITEVDSMLSLLIKEIKEEGKIEGKLEGKLEKAYEDAKLMKENGIQIEIISKITGLSAEEINKL